MIVKFTLKINKETHLPFDCDGRISYHYVMSGLKSITVLLVDDDVYFAKVVQRQLSTFDGREFKFLWRLLLHHGRLCYLRNAEMLLYFFYKNLVLTLPHIMFAFYNGLSGATIYDDFYITSFNMFFTAWPVIWRATTE